MKWLERALASLAVVVQAVFGASLLFGASSAEAASVAPLGQADPAARGDATPLPPPLTADELRRRDVQYALAAPFMRSPARIERLRGLGAGCILRTKTSDKSAAGDQLSGQPAAFQLSLNEASSSSSSMHDHSCFVGGRVQPSLWLGIAAGRSHGAAASRLVASAAFMIMDRLVLATSHGFLPAAAAQSSGDAMRTWHLGLRWRGEAWEVGYSERRSQHLGSGVYRDRAHDVVFAWLPVRRLAVEFAATDGLAPLAVAGWSGLDEAPLARAPRQVALGARWQWELATLHAALDQGLGNSGKSAKGVQLGVDAEVASIHARIGLAFDRHWHEANRNDLATMQLTLGL